MELIERYLQAVQFWLPARLKQDIIAELSEDLYAQIEERETGLGRKLTREETESFLKERGSPVLVANSYLPQRSLIGPLLYPVYLFVLKIVAIAFLVPWGLSVLSLIAFDPAYRAGWVAQSWIHNLGAVTGSLWNSAFITVGVVTLVFATIERFAPEKLFKEDWNPRSLPPLRNHNLIPRFESYCELTASLICGGWMAATMSSRVVLDRPHAHIVLSHLWRYFFWGYLFLVLAQVGLSTANLLRPYWTRQRAALRLLLECAGAALFCWLVKANIFVEIALPNLTPQRNLELPGQVNYWLEKSFPCCVLVCLILLGVNIWRILRIKNGAEISNGIGAAPLGSMNKG